MKPKWQVSWWDDNKDALAVRGFHSYEEAVTHQYKIKEKFNRRADIKLRATS